MRAKIGIVLICMLAMVLNASSIAAYPLGQRVDERNASIKPKTKGNVTTFGIRSGECSSKTYSKGESDCTNGNVRSSLNKKWVKLGKTYRYSMDFKVDPGIQYRGWKNSWANGFLPGGWDSRLRFGAWLGDGKHNFLYLLKLDGRYGVRFAGKTCAGPSEFGKWVSFEMTVKWTNQNDGWMQVKCNGKTIFSMVDRPTTINTPHCYITNICNPKLKNNPKQIGFELGIVMQGFGPDWKKRGKRSPFTEFNGDIIVQVRKVKMRPFRKK